MPNPATRTALMGPRGEPVVGRAWLCLERLAGYRVLSAQPQTLVFDLRVAGASRTLLKPQTTGDLSHGDFAYTSDKHVGRKQSHEAQIWLIWPYTPKPAQ